MRPIRYDEKEIEKYELLENFDSIEALNKYLETR
jgi:hypothetical protein